MDRIRDVFLSMRLEVARVVSRIVPPHEVEDIVADGFVSGGARVYIAS